jgi:hypothetical protein
MLIALISAEANPGYLTPPFLIMPVVLISAEATLLIMPIALISAEANPGHFNQGLWR